MLGRANGSSALAEQPFRRTSYNYSVTIGALTYWALEAIKNKYRQIAGPAGMRRRYIPYRAGRRVQRHRGLIVLARRGTRRQEQPALIKGGTATPPRHRRRSFRDEFQSKALEPDISSWCGNCRQGTAGRARLRVHNATRITVYPMQRRVSRIGRPVAQLSG